MSRVTAKYKVCRRLGEGVYEKCQTEKFATRASKKRTTRQTGGKGKRRRNLTDFGRQLLEKQKIRFSYGITERQLVNYVNAAKKQSRVSPADALFSSLESRLDSVVYRSGLTNSRNFARQLVTHGHMSVDGRRVNIPSYHLSHGVSVSIREGSRGKTVFGEAKEKMKEMKGPSWINVDSGKLTMELKGDPVVGEMDTNLNFGSIIEFYSRA